VNAMLRVRVGLLAAVVAAPWLTACAPLVVGGAAATSALVASDRRTAGAQLEDKRIELKASGSIQKTLGDKVHVSVTSFNRRVLLTGEVPTQKQKEDAEKIVRQIENIGLIHNDLAIAGPSSLMQRSSDALLSAGVKTRMITTRGLDPNAISITSERGSVYLMGIVTKREAELATEAARSFSGVQRVVQVFELISEEQLRQMNPPPAPAQPQKPPAK
jgi:osmotically-inducible protein OsmY